jgi:hypothetical protein
MLKRIRKICKTKNSYELTEGYLGQKVAGATLVTVAGVLVLMIGRAILKRIATRRFNLATVVQFYSGLL